MSGRKTDTLTIRIEPALRARLDGALEALPYKPSVTAVVERGIKLAIEEMEAWTKASKAGAE